MRRALWGLTAAAAVACQGSHGGPERGPQATGQVLDGAGGAFTLRHGALGCQFEVVIEDMEPDAARAAALGGLPILADVEKALSVWDPESEVSRVNRLAADGEGAGGAL